MTFYRTKKSVNVCSIFYARIILEDPLKCLTWLFTFRAEACDFCFW
jgi:hypothetical protein